MRSTYLRAVILAVAASAVLTIVTASAVGADPETVLVRNTDFQSPGSATGWIKVALRGEGTPQEEKSHAYCRDGYAYATQWPPMGYGSFFEKVYEYYGTKPGGPYNDDFMPRVLLGTNELNGVLLKDIMSITYYACLAGRAYWGQSGAGTPSGQPPMAQIHTDSGHTTQERIFAFFPFGAPPGRASGSGTYDTRVGLWEYYDATAYGGSYWELYNNSSGNFFGDWNWVVNRYYNPTYPTEYPKIVKPVTGGSYDEYPAKCATGAGFNIKIGSYMASETNREGCFAWWKEGTGVSGYVDALQIVWVKDGVTYDKTWNFDIGTPVGTSNRSTRDAIMTDKPNPAQPNIMIGPRHSFPFVLWGRVTENSYGPTTFEIDDYSGLPIKVICAEGHWVGIGQYVTAKGIFNNSVTPPVLYCQFLGINILQY